MLHATYHQWRTFSGKFLELGGMHCAAKHFLLCAVYAALLDVSYCCPLDSIDSMQHSVEGRVYIPEEMSVHHDM